MGVFSINEGKNAEKLEVSDAAMDWVLNTTKYKSIHSEKYKKLQEADEGII